jgi:hypothetical protein
LCYAVGRYSVEYDCGGNNYCVHFSARKPVGARRMPSVRRLKLRAHALLQVMSELLLQRLIGLVDDMKLNVHNLSLHVTNQTACW